ncbi:hypothetical protein ACLOJK_012376 [Asimina triloba]
MGDAYRFGLSVVRVHILRLSNLCLCSHGCSRWLSFALMSSAANACLITLVGKFTTENEAGKGKGGYKEGNKGSFETS